MMDTLSLRTEQARPKLAGDTARIERIRYNYLYGEHELQIFASAPTQRLLEAVRSGEAEFALVADEPLILVCARFGDVIPWTAASYCWHHAPREQRVLPPVDGSVPETRALLEIQLIDSATGLVKVQRNVTLWLHFTRALHEAIREQARIAFDPRAYERALAKVRQRFPSDERLARGSTIRSVGSL